MDSAARLTCVRKSLPFIMYLPLENLISLDFSFLVYELQILITHFRVIEIIH